jgi:hypothetical protein
VIASVIGHRVRSLVVAAAVLGTLVPAAVAQEAPPADRVDAAGLKALLNTLGYQPRESRNEAGVEYEIVLRAADTRAITTRVTLSKDGALVWLVAWLKRVPTNRTISGNAVLGMLIENDAIGPTHFSYNEGRRWFFLNKPVVNVDLTAERLRGEFTHLGATVSRTEGLWDPDRWKK